MATTTQCERFQAMDESFLEEQTSEQHLCQDCGKVYKVRHGLLKHVLREHGQRDEFKHKCGVCDKSFVEKHQLIAHLVKHGRPGFDCVHCDKKYSTRFALKRHTSHEHDGTKSECALCRSAFTSKDILDDHIAAKHKQLFRYVCKEHACGAKYRWRTSLARHVKSKHAN